MMSVKISCIVTGTSIVPQMNVVMSRACKGCCVTYTLFKGFVWELNNFVLFYLFLGTKQQQFSTKVGQDRRFFTARVYVAFSIQMDLAVSFVHGDSNFTTITGRAGWED